MTLKLVLITKVLYKPSKWWYRKVLENACSRQVLQRERERERGRER
jgi:hypothetical protein